MNDEEKHRKIGARMTGVSIAARDFNAEELKRLDNRWKSDVDLKLDALIRAEEDWRKKYSAFIDILIQREADRAALRKAVIEKTLSGLIWMAVVGLVSLAWSGGRAEITSLLDSMRGGK